MFLSTVLNKSTRWRVYHEPRSIGEPRNDQQIEASMVAERFQQPYYGEVNSRLRWIAPELSCRLGVIIRDPYELTRSVYNKAKRNAKNGKHKTNRLLHDTSYMRECLHAVDKLVQLGAGVVFFERMTTDPKYLAQVFTYFGVTDYKPTKDDLKPRNVNTRPEALTWQDIPSELRDKLVPEIQWFKEKYYGEKPEIPNPI